MAGPRSREGQGWHRAGSQSRPTAPPLSSQTAPLGAGWCWQLPLQGAEENLHPRARPSPGGGAPHLEFVRGAPQAAPDPTCAQAPRSRWREEGAFWWVLTTAQGKGQRLAVERPRTRTGQDPRGGLWDLARCSRLGRHSPRWPPPCNLLFVTLGGTRAPPARPDSLLGWSAGQCGARALWSAGEGSPLPDHPGALDKGLPALSGKAFFL